MTPKHQTGLFICLFITNLNLLEYCLLKLKIDAVFRDMVHLPTAHFTE